MAFSAGQRLTAGGLNDVLPLHIGAVCSSFSLTSSGATYFAVQFTSQLSSNTTGMWSLGQPTRFVAPTEGTYDLTGFINWPSNLGTNTGRGTIRINGSATDAPGARVSTELGSSGNDSTTISGHVVMNAGDYLEVLLNQATGAAITVNGALEMNRISRSTS